MAAPALPDSLRVHRVNALDIASVVDGTVRWDPAKSIWFTTMFIGATVGGAMTFTWTAFALFVASTAIVLLFGHSLGMHRRLIHDSFQCPRWLERVLVYCGVQVGLAGPLGLLHQHELRDFAQRLPRCHDYLTHRRAWWRDAWWQLHCRLDLDAPPVLVVEPRLANDRYLAWLDRTWMWQHLPWAIAGYALGGWGFVCWGVCARVVAGVGGHWVIGFLAHNHGPMPITVRDAAAQGHNVPFTALVTMGECWHNNHHAYPGSARLGLRDGEWDPGWWVLVALRRAGLAWDLREPHHLPPRAELVATTMPSAAAAEFEMTRGRPDVA